MEVYGAAPNRAKAKRRKACNPQVSWPSAAKPDFRWAGSASWRRSWCDVPRYLPEETSRPPPTSGSRRERKNEMAKGREESDGREVPKSRRQSAVTALKDWRRGGKATTASKQTRQLGLFSETAESPKGDDDEADEGLPMPATCAGPKSENTKGQVTSAMTMEQWRELWTRIVRASAQQSLDLR